MNLRIALLALTLGALIGCQALPKQGQKKSKLPAIKSERIQFIRTTEIVYMDLLEAAVTKKPTPTTEVVVEEIKRQRVVGSEVLEKGDLYNPCVTDLKNPNSIVTVSGEVEDWALIETAVW